MSIEQTIIENELLDPRSDMGHFVLPCGYIIDTDDGKKLLRDIHLREMTGHEEDLLSADMAFDRKMNGLIAACTQSLGPIEDPRMIAKIVPKLLEGDRLFLFFALRRVSLGDSYPFREKCPSCSKMSVHNFNLADLEMVEMPDPMKRAYEVTLPGSNDIAVIRCLTGEDEPRRQQLKNRLQPLSLQIFLRLVSYNGEEATINHVRGMTQRDRAFLRGKFVEIDGGVETRIKLNCSKCSYEFERDLDPSHPGFFSPSETLAVWNRRSGT